MALACGGRVDVEEASYLVVRQSLEGAHEEDVPVDFRKLSDGLAAAPGQFPLGKVLTRRRPRRGQLRRQQDPVYLTRGTLAAPGPSRRFEVLPFDHAQPFLGGL